MTLEGLTAIHARIAQIQSHIDSIGVRERPTVAAPSVGSGPSSFADVLNGLQSAPSSAGGVGSYVDPTVANALGGTADLGSLSGPGTTNATGTANFARAVQKYGTFASDLLDRLGAPKTAENQRAIVAWATAEGTRASNNPLATTRTAPGTTDFNSVGVKNYPSYDEGVQATADTLRNGRYGAILDALSSGQSAQAVAQAVAASPWGTGHGVERTLSTF